MSEQDEQDQVLCVSLVCPDGTELVSYHRHDFKKHTQKDGKEYFIDGGGKPYYRSGGTDGGAIVRTIKYTDPHYIVRRYFKWTSSLDQDGNLLDKPVTSKLMDLENNHINALVFWTKSDYPERVHNIFVKEQEWRIWSESNTSDE